MESVAVSVKGLTAGYTWTPVIKDVTFESRFGEITMVAGPNGGGKTTLLNVLLGLLAPMGGEVRILGCGPGECTDSVGYVPQFGTFDRDYPMTVYELVLGGLRSRKGIRPFYSRREKELAKDELDRLNLTEFSDSSVGGLSGGQLQRALIGRAMVSNPKLLILDEPTASLDPVMTGRTFDILEKMAAEGVAVIVATHDMDMAPRSDTVVFMNHRAKVGTGKEFSHKSGWEALLKEEMR